MSGDDIQVMMADTTTSVRTWIREIRKPVRMLTLVPTTTIGRKRIDVCKLERDSTRWKLEFVSSGDRG